MSDLKARASRELNRTGTDANDKRWTRHGSTRHLFDDASVAAAVAYTLDEQGSPMAVYDPPRESRARSRRFPWKHLEASLTEKVMSGFPKDGLPSAQVQSALTSVRRLILLVPQGGIPVASCAGRRTAYLVAAHFTRALGLRC